MSGWVAIPHAALAVAGSDPVRRLAVLSLWEQADRVGYRWMPWVERDLAKAWATDRRGVCSLLEALEAAGCVQVERSAPRSRAPSRMLVRRATGGGPDSGPVGNRSASQSLHQYPDSPAGRHEVIGEPVVAPDGVPDGEPVPVPPRAELFPHAKTRPDQTRQEEQHVGLTTDEPTVLDGPSLAYLQAAAYFGEVVHRQIGRRPSKGPARSSKAGKRLYAECKRDPERVLDALRFAGESQIERAVKLREYAGLTVETVLRHLDEYAELWRAHGDRPPPARGPPLNGRRMGHAGDGVLEAMWAERNPPRDVYDGDG